MQALTALVLALFAGYAGAWYFGVFEGNFALLLFLATAETNRTADALATAAPPARACSHLTPTGTKASIKTKRPTEINVDVIVNINLC